MTAKTVDVTRIVCAKSLTYCALSLAIAFADKRGVMLQDLKPYAALSLQLRRRTASTSQRHDALSYLFRFAAF